VCCNSAFAFLHSDVYHSGTAVTVSAVAVGVSKPQ